MRATVKVQGGVSNVLKARVIIERGCRDQVYVQTQNDVLSCSVDEGTGIEFIEQRYGVRPEILFVNSGI